MRSLRLVLPAIGAVMAAGLFISFQTIPSAVDNVDLGTIGIDGDMVTMQAPKLTGYGNDGMSYAVSANNAAQNLTKPNVVHLNGIDGRMDEGDGNWTSLKADKGVLDTEAETLQLNDKIELTTKDGKHAKLQSAYVDFSDKTVTTDQPVQMDMDVGRAEAKSMSVSEGGKRILMRGNVVVDLNSDRMNANEAPAAE